MVDAINQMAEKIERQIAGQRELLAAVSHEIRSPLARLRVLCELAREESGVDAARLDAMDVELSELDTLVGQLLAHSRLEFQSLERKTLTAREVARTVLERASMPTTLLRDESEGATVSVDMSLFSRAMLNLVDNAQRHGGGLEVLLLRRSGERVVFEFCDHGPGFDEQTLHRAFVPFAGKNAGAGLGLGLSLVERIVRAHGGQVKLGNAVEGGARVTVETPVETSAARK
jgi:signal transduction histidine kinase